MTYPTFNRPVIVLRSLTLALAGSLLTGYQATAQTEGSAWEATNRATAASYVHGVTSATEAHAALLPEAWAPADQGDSLYREARRALNDQEWSRAAELFRRLRRRHQDSEYAADAFYWEAFALQRAGGTANLRRALNVLEDQRDRYPRAATRGDAEALETRIEGMLARQGDSRAAERLVERTQRLEQSGERSQCPDEEDDTRMAALNALMHMNAEQALPVLEKVLERRDACSVPLRRKAMFVISQQRGAAREAILLRAARTDPDLEVREQAIFWLSQVHSDEAIEALDSIIMFSDEPRLQEKAIFALSQHRGERASEILREYVHLDDRPVELRGKAIFWLGQKRGSRAYLEDLYGQLTNFELKEKVLFAVSQHQGGESVDWLVDRALDPNEEIEIRKKALFWAGQHRALDLARLDNLYGQVDDRELKEQIIFVYSQRREPDAALQLMDIARTETDIELKKKAIFWLGQSRDPRVAEFLLEIIDQ